MSFSRFVSLGEDYPTIEFVPSPPRGTWKNIRGTFHFPKKPEYPQTAKSLQGKYLEIIVQDELDPIWGLRVWMKGEDGKWWLQTTHVQNTLLEDPEFLEAINFKDLYEPNKY